MLDTAIRLSGQLDTLFEGSYAIWNGIEKNDIENIVSDTFRRVVCQSALLDRTLDRLGSQTYVCDFYTRLASISSAIVFDLFRDKKVTSDCFVVCVDNIIVDRDLYSYR